MVFIYQYRYHDSAGVYVIIISCMCVLQSYIDMTGIIKLLIKGHPLAITQLGYKYKWWSLSWSRNSVLLSGRLLGNMI